MTFTTFPDGASEHDVTALVECVAAVARTQRAEDVEGFLALFDQRAVWVTGGGHRLIGRDSIATFTRKVLPGAFATGTVRYDVEHIRFITADVALTCVNQEYLTAEGAPLTPPQVGRPSYLWHRQNGYWRMVGGQNTMVPPEPEESDPE